MTITFNNTEPGQHYAGMVRATWTDATGKERHVHLPAYGPEAEAEVIAHIEMLSVAEGGPSC